MISLHALTQLHGYDIMISFRIYLSPVTLDGPKKALAIL
jgi:hypothetical protein